MKKVMMIAAIAALLVSCQSKGTRNNESATTDKDTTALAGNDAAAASVFEGILPAADGPGIRYVLSVENMNTDEAGAYTLVTTYLDAKGAGKDDSFTSKGTKQFIKKNVDNQQKTAIKLTPENGDAPVYFIVVNDTTLRLVGEDLKEMDGKLNYDLTLVK